MRRSAATVLLGIAFLLVGCALVPGPDPRVDAVPVSKVTCPETYVDGYAEAGLVPKGFDAVAVLRCDPYSSQQDDDEVWSGALLERLEGDLDVVLAVLALPSEPRTLGPCPAIANLTEELWLEEAGGDVVRIAVPADGCGAPKEVGLESALAALTVVDRTFTRDSLLESTAAASARCATQTGMLVFAGPDEPDGPGAESVMPEADHLVDDGLLVPHEMPGWPDPTDVTGARLCDYVSASVSATASAPVGHAGVFVGVREMTADAARALVSEARRAPAAPSCTDVATQFVVVHLLRGEGEAGTFTVELDGCRRLASPDLQALTASADTLTFLSPSG